MAKIDHDNNGFPVLLADKKSNPFIKKKDLARQELPEIVTPDGTSGPAEWGRYHDAVREAARQFDDPQDGDIHNFLNSRARNPEQVDVPAFHEAVARQRMADLVDIVDHHMRKAGSLPRGSRNVRVQAPKGYMRRTLRKMKPEELAHLKHRLVSIGHDDQRVSNYLSDRVGADMWDEANTYEVRAADTEFLGLTFDDSDSDDEWEEMPFDDVADFVQNIYENMPPPVINVYVDSKEKPE